MKALVTKPCSINSVPAKAGDVVEVDSNTLENLSRKGLLKPHAEAPAQDETHEEEGGKKKSKTKDT